MESTEKAYIAGVIDGEGSIMLTKRSNRTGSPTVSVSSTDRELLDYLKEVVESGVIVSKRTYEDHHRPSWEWKLVGRKALDFLEDIEPYLRIERKRARVRLLLDEYVSLTPRNGKYTPEMLAAKVEFEHRFASV